MNVEDAAAYPGETVLLRKRAYILSDMEDGTSAWLNEDIKVSITCEASETGSKWIALDSTGHLLASGPTCEILLRRLLPIEHGLSVTDDALRAVYEVAERILRNKRALGPMSTGERIAAALIFDKRTWISEYSMLGAIDRLGRDWCEATLTVRNHLVSEGKVLAAPMSRRRRRS